MEEVSPRVMGRYGDGDQQERAPTKHILSCACEFWGGTTGRVLVNVFESTDRGNHGGIVLRIELLGDEYGTFVPYTRQGRNGLEIHMAGDIEAAALMAALRRAIGSRTVARFARSRMGSEDELAEGYPVRLWSSAP